MKRLLLPIAILSLLTSGCNKDDKKTEPAPDNYWKVAGTTYVVTASQTSLGNNTVSLTATDVASVGAPSNSLAFVFDPTPVGSGNIVIGDDTGRMSIAVIVDGATKKTYYNQDPTTATASYSYVNGLLTVDVPETWIVNIDHTDSVRFSGHVYGD